MRARENVRQGCKARKSQPTPTPSVTLLALVAVRVSSAVRRGSSQRRSLPRVQHRDEFGRHCCCERKGWRRGARTRRRCRGFAQTQTSCLRQSLMKAGTSTVCAAIAKPFSDCAINAARRHTYTRARERTRHMHTYHTHTYHTRTYHTRTYPYHRPVVMLKTRKSWQVPCACAM